MGVPGFFGWLWKKYKSKHFVISRKSIKDYVDSSENKTLHEHKMKLSPPHQLFLDANGLIHPQCFAVLAESPEIAEDFTRLENKMMRAVLAYIDELFDIVKPTELFYIAIDGVAPFAKIRQQRTRRFKSFSDQVLFNNIKHKHGKPSVEPHKLNKQWTNACITPGTMFMEQLHNKIKEHIGEKMAEWKTNSPELKVIYSSCYTPGEGEHKLITHIKQNRDDTKTKVIYGLDADLIFLALACDQPNIYLLREAQQMGTTSDNKTATSDFNYVAIDVMKDCIEDEINQLVRDIMKTMTESETKNEAMNEQTNELTNELTNEPTEVKPSPTEDASPTVKYDRTRLINDFIFVCYFLGNDFVPHLPSLDIYIFNKKIKNGLSLLLDTYARVLLQKETYMIELDKATNKVTLSIDCMLMFMDILAQNEVIILKEMYKQRNSRFHQKNPHTDPYDYEMFKIENLQFTIHDPIELGKEDNPEKWKERYYSHYFQTHLHQRDNIMKICKDYFSGLLWIAEYYFFECPSWDYAYPYSSAPFLQDMYYYLKNHELKPSFNRNTKPLTPLEQLLTVLPPQYARLLPSTLQYYVLHHNSPIIQYYPTDFKIDLLHKHKYWQGVPIIPNVNPYHVHKCLEKSINDKRLNKQDIILNRYEPNALVFE